MNVASIVFFGVVVMAPRQNNIARLRRPPRAKRQLGAMGWHRSPEQQGGLKTVASSDVAAE
jgi:hypothetical protein